MKFYVCIERYLFFRTCGCSLNSVNLCFSIALEVCIYDELRVSDDVMQIKHASMKLAKMYMRRVIMELELARNSDRESNQEALVLQGVHFAYRTHQVMLGLLLR